MTDVVRAAGGVVVRRDAAERVQVALVHRPKYDDWSFPKGKLLAGEEEPEAALREVNEETGLICRIERVVGDVTYEDRAGRPKIVRYYLMTTNGGTFAPTSEVDRLVWSDVADAAGVLTYERDARLLRDAIAEKDDA
jgi:8-oxo-dGTP pyrophosphatase MutT (NUDIX family)